MDLEKMRSHTLFTLVGAIWPCIACQAFLQHDLRGGECQEHVPAGYVTAIQAGRIAGGDCRYRTPKEPVPSAGAGYVDLEEQLYE